MENYEKKYKEALGWMQSLYKGLHGATKEEAEHYFPELNESENERIRKELLDYLKRFIPHHDIDLVTKSKGWIAWLEKQGEQKPVEQDTEICDLWVYIREWKDKFGRLPKDDDELAACIDYVMKRQKPTDKIEQNHAWSEEDEEKLNSITEVLGEDSLLVVWLKSLKYRVQPQPKQDWSEKDEENLNWVINVWNRLRRGGDAQTTPNQMEYLENWLKSLKPKPLEAE